MKRPQRRNVIGRLRALLVSAFAALVLCLPAAALAQDDPAPPPAAETSAASTEAPASVPAAKPAVDPAPTPAATEPKAADPAPAELTALDNLSSELMNILVPAFLTLISLLVAFVLNWIRKRFKLNVSDSQISCWSYLARKAALRGAEWARKKVKAVTERKKIPGPDILEVAVNWAVEAGKAAGLPEMGRKKLEGWIEAELFELRREQIPPVAADPYIHVEDALPRI